MITYTEMEKRIEYANKVIEIISRHGRRFFLDLKTNTTSFFYLEDGDLFYLDEYYKTVGKITLETEWYDLKWVNHGSGLKGAISRMGEFILGKIDEYYPWMEHWGYDEKEQKKVLDEIYNLNDALEPKTEVEE